MAQEDVKRKYFQWICSVVCDKRHPMYRYERLLYALHDREFTFMMDMDENRAADGIDLRNRFVHEFGCFHHRGFDTGPCSVLEMMVALSIRCEEHIMDDPEIGNRTGEWFWLMIDNLDLMSMDNDNFNVAYVDEVIDIFLAREYHPNGRGGLFPAPSFGYDMRTIDIWYQMMRYLNSIM